MRSGAQREEEYRPIKRGFVVQQTLGGGLCVGLYYRITSHQQCQEEVEKNSESFGHTEKCCETTVTHTCRKWEVNASLQHWHYKPIPTEQVSWSLHTVTWHPVHGSLQVCCSVSPHTASPLKTRPAIRAWYRRRARENSRPRKQAQCASLPIHAVCRKIRLEGDKDGSLQL